MNSLIYLLITIVFFVAMLAYFRLADKYNIIDKPNERSSHNNITIRGGGIIFILAALAGLILHPADFWLPILGILIIGGISFADDILSLSNRIRIVFHIAAVTIMLYYLRCFGNLPAMAIVALYILIIGIINAYNFMDGINGITGLYSLVVLGGLQYMNLEQVHFIASDMIWLPMIACVVFLFFNFRKKAACFAGDVGSVTIAFWIVTLLLNLIFVTGNWVYLLFLAVYGVDAILTIIHRLLLGQNIFKAHRLHFYQILANERRIPHLVIAASYAVLQVAIICLIIGRYQEGQLWSLCGAILLPLVIVYIVFKKRLMHA